MRDQLPAFEQLGVRPVCIVQGTASEASRFCGRHGIEDLCIGDPEKTSYRAMGFDRISWKAILRASDDLRRRRAEARAAGCGYSALGTFQRHTDVLQLPGAALIAQRGTILWLHRGVHPGDLPSIDHLLSMVREHLVR